MLRSTVILRLDTYTHRAAGDYIDAKQFNFPSIAKGAATQRLISDFAALKGSDTKTVAGFEAAPHNGNLYCWRVKIFPPPDSLLYKDMKTLRSTTDAIDLEMLFPSEYPYVSLCNLCDCVSFLG